MIKKRSTREKNRIKYMDGSTKKEKRVKTKKEILGYTVTLTSGKKIYCEKIYKNKQRGSSAYGKKH
ncbi:MAG: hypothetical protein D3910_14600 [Candidatus Electrothrix sp. ATG2]|nr:hypothetical protein [Candidatus Electrothrix sp. ATG2]